MKPIIAPIKNQIMRVKMIKNIKITLFETTPCKINRKGRVTIEVKAITAKSGLIPGEKILSYIKETKDNKIKIKTPIIPPLNPYGNSFHPIFLRLTRGF